MSAQPRWDQTQPAPRPVLSPARGAHQESERNAARIVSVIALTSMAAGAIHVSAAGTLGRGSAQNLAFFGVVAAAQIVWGAVALAWAPRWWLALGALGNAVVVATWVVSRTVGLPSASSPAWSCPSASPTPWPRSWERRPLSALRGWPSEGRVQPDPRLVCAASRSRPRS